MLIFASTPAEQAGLRAWAVDRIPHMAGGDFDGPSVDAAVLHNGTLAAAVFFHDWQPAYGTLQVSMAAATPRWATPGVLRALLRYAFVTCGANKLWIATPHVNVRAVRFCEGIGMKREATLGHHFGHNTHAVVCRMLKRDWQRSRWFGE